MVSTIRYSANASSDHHPNQVPGILIIIKPKQPNLPICSATSINLLLHLFSKPSLHLIAKIILGIIMTAIIISPNIFNQPIYSSANSNLHKSAYQVICSNYIDKNCYTCKYHSIFLCTIIITIPCIRQKG